MSAVVFQILRDAASLDAWEPVDGRAILTCQIRVQSGAYDVWEPRTYEFQRTSSGWIIDTSPGCLRRDRWSDVVDWLCRMQPRCLELVVTA